MRIFDEFRQKNESLQQLVDDSSENRQIQGLVLEMNKTWLLLWRLRERFGMDWIISSFNWLEEVFFFFRPGRYAFNSHFDLHVFDLARQHLESESWIPIRPFGFQDMKDFKSDLEKRMRWNANKAFHLQNLFLLRVCLYPAYHGEKTVQLKEYGLEDLRIIYEARGTGHLYSAAKKLHNPVIGGTSIGVGSEDYGTLGGILEDYRSGKFYGLTCAHVARKDGATIMHPAVYDDPAHNMKIGIVAQCSDLQACDVLFLKTTDLSMTNEMDLALIELDAVPDARRLLHIGEVNGYVRDYFLMPHLAASFSGRSSDHKQYLSIDGQVLFYDLKEGENTYRYKNLTQFTMAGKWSNLFSEPAKSGDSGAWLCTPNGNSNAWCGMVIGGYNQTGFAYSAEKILSWISQNTALNLRMIS